MIFDERNPACNESIEFSYAGERIKLFMIPQLCNVDVCKACIKRSVSTTDHKFLNDPNKTKLQFQLQMCCFGHFKGSLKYVFADCPYKLEHLVSTQQY